jgi:lipopolysaccharide transport system ATP-binding protein
MAELAIRVEKLGKQYRIGAGRPGYRTFREALVDGLTAQIKRLRSLSVSGEDQTIWALRDVSFEVKHGEVLGIIGRNGAGKSTLLKILSRITEPTEGHVEIQGRVGSLLEVGTGFHPELTGRDNIYLNGAILGMRRTEIQSKFDDIVAFAEVERFIDTPVKRYSSGMYMRLAFAVAAHLEPEILLVDEILAVGDLAFQKKCLGKMGDVAKEGRTVLFVSHNLAAVKALCNRAILLHDGRIRQQGEVLQAVLSYLDNGPLDSPIKEIAVEAHLGDTSRIRVCTVELTNPHSGAFAVLWKQPIELCIEIEVKDWIENACFGLGIVTLDGIAVLTVHHNDLGSEPWAFSPGHYQVRVALENNLRAGVYKLSIGAHELVAKDPIFYVPDAVRFEVLDVHAQGSIDYISHNAGLVNGSSGWRRPELVQRLMAG